MNCYLYEGERLVFEGEGWGIIVDDGSSKRRHTEGSVYGTHQVCTKSYMQMDEDYKDERLPYGEKCWAPDRSELTGAVCCLCAAAVPDGVQALILMQLWADRS